jgi:stearoyl-CoA desaturase (delta-9 desaturase)
MSSVPPARSAPTSTVSLIPRTTPKPNADANFQSSEKFIEDPEHIPADSNIPDNYVSYTLKNQKALPPITWDNWYTELNWLHFAILAGSPVVGFIGAYHTHLRWETAVWGVVYYYMTGLGTLHPLLVLVTSLLLQFQGITAGYHRLWAHRAYNASKPLQYVLALLGAGAVEGSIKWWSRGHRAHHRYTDTDLDPYNAHRGLLWSHIGWMIVKPRRKPGVADVSDLTKNEIVRWQHRYYLWLVVIMGIVVPTVVAGLCWGDWKGGYIYAGLLRLCFVHHVHFFFFLFP